MKEKKKKGSEMVSKRGKSLIPDDKIMSTTTDFSSKHSKDD